MKIFSDKLVKPAQNWEDHQLLPFRQITLTARAQPDLATERGANSKRTAMSGTDLKGIKATYFKTTDQITKPPPRLRPLSLHRSFIGDSLAFSWLEDREEVLFDLKKIKCYRPGVGCFVWAVWRCVSGTYLLRETDKQTDRQMQRMVDGQRHASKFQASACACVYV